MRVFHQTANVFPGRVLVRKQDHVIILCWKKLISKVREHHLVPLERRIQTYNLIALVLLTVRLPLMSTLGRAEPLTLEYSYISDAFYPRAVG